MDHGNLCGVGVHPRPEGIHIGHKQVLCSTISWIVVSDRISAYKHLPTQKQELCLAHLLRAFVRVTDARAPAASSVRNFLTCSDSRLITGTFTRMER